jgi:hypothetical protein
MGSSRLIRQTKRNNSGFVESIDMWYRNFIPVRGEIGPKICQTPSRPVAQIGYEVVEFYPTLFQMGLSPDYAKDVRTQWTI